MTLFLTLLKSPYSWLLAALIGVGAWGYGWKLDAQINAKKLQAETAEATGLTTQRDNALVSAKTCSDATAALQKDSENRIGQAQAAYQAAVKGQGAAEARIVRLAASLKANNAGKTCRDALTELRGQK